MNFDLIEKCMGKLLMAILNFTECSAVLQDNDEIRATLCTYIMCVFAYLGNMSSLHLYCTE